MRFFTKEEDQFLKDNYLSIPAKRMGRILGRSESSARQRIKLIGLKVPAEITAKFKQDSLIKKGNIPMNKGKRQEEYMNVTSIEKTAATRFKKGHLRHNTKADHVITIRADKRGINYQFIRIALGKWIPLHHYNWIEANGPIPPKMKLIFKNSDTMDCSVNNIEILSYDELMRRNSYHNLPAPLPQIIQLSGALTRQINKKTKLLQNEK